MVQEVRQAFRPRARLLQLLGDQLIGSPRLALFELVKNAYDAGATFVDIEMTGLDSDGAEITVRDDGSGMSAAVIRDVWLVPGHDHRQVQRDRAKSERTSPASANSDSADGRRKSRLPLGEKGLGRFAAHKLGSRIRVVTRAADEPEVVVEIDWDELISKEYLDEGEVLVQTRAPHEFLDDETGTLIRISELRGEPWTRGEVRRLARQITSISSPFQEREDRFQATLAVPERPEWLKDVPTVQDLISRAPFTFKFTLVDNSFDWEYQFHGFPGIGAESRKAGGVREGVLLDNSYIPRSMKEKSSYSSASVPVVSTTEFADGIGPVSGRLYVFDRDRDILQRSADSQGIQSFLDENGGIRVYRDGIRVYNYGEPGDDWLGIDLRRVNAPSKRISNNIAIGAVDITLNGSESLREKTNREGFDENDAYARFRALVMGAVAVFEAERLKDKEIVRRLLRKAKSESDADIAKPLAVIARIARKNGFATQISPHLQSAQANFDSMREIMLRSGTSNMSLSIVFHEIDHGVKLLHRSVQAGVPQEQILAQTLELTKLLDGFGDLLRRGEVATHDLRDAIARTLELNRIRLRNHDVKLETNLESIEEAVYARFPMGLVLGAMTNLIDNSVYWLRTKYPDELTSSQRRLFVGIDTHNFSGPTIVIGDNGPGFLDDIGEVTRPFFSRRPDGIGIGLYYVSLIMGLSNGAVDFIRSNDSCIPEEYVGARIALNFESVS